MGLFKPNIKKLKAKKNVKGLIEALKYRRDYGELSNEACRALGDLGDEAIDELLKAINHKNEIIRFEIAIFFMNRNEQRAYDPFLKVLGDKNIRISSAAACTIGRTIKKIEPKLIKLLSNSDWESRRGALEAITEYRKHNNVTDNQLLEEISELSNDDNWNVRELVAQLLGTFNDKRAKEYLKQLVNDEDLDVSERAKQELKKIEI